MWNLSAILILLIISINPSFSQTQKIDSLSQLVHSHTQKDSIRVNVLNNLAIELQNIDLEKAKDLIEEAQEISVEINYSKGNANSLYNLGFYYWNKGNYDTSLLVCNQALSIFKSLNYAEGEIKCYNRISVNYIQTGNYNAAIENCYNGIKLSEETKNYTQLGKIYNNLGVLYGDLNSFEKALEYNIKALEYKKRINDKYSIGIAINNIAYYNFELGNIPEAHKYFKHSLQYNSEINNKRILGFTYQSLGAIYDIMGKYDSAYVFHQKGLKIMLDFEGLGLLARSYNLIGNHFLIKGNYYKTIEFANKALDIAREIGRKQYILKSYELLYKAYSNLSDKNKAFEFLLAYKLLNDELKKDENIKLLAIQEKELKLKLNQQQIKFEQEKLLTKQRIQKNYFIIAFVLSLIAILFIAYKLFKKIRRNKMLHDANKIRDKMMTLVAHDFRSPLISISSSIQVIPMLMKEEEWDAINKMFKNIESYITSVLSLIDNLINWTLSQNEQIPYRPENYNLSDIGNQLIEIYNPIASYKKIELVNNIPIDTYVYADKDILNVVLRNLINNAIKFTPENGKIEMFATNKISNIEVSVIDNGIGISKGNLKSLFELYHKKGQGTLGEKGSGLGLFFCKEFVHKNKGAIWVESEPGHGSSFYFTVPNSN